LGSGPALYFLNGFVGSQELFALLAWLLRDQFRCVVFDYPPSVSRGWTLADAVADLLAIADQAGDAEFHLFGHSFGSMVALQALAEHPQRIRRAVLQGAFAHYDWSTSERLLLSAGRLLPGRVKLLPGRVFIQRQNQGRWFPPFDLTRLQFYLENTGNSTIRQLALRASLARSCDLRPRLPEIRQPVLLLRSEGDGHVLTGCSETLAAGLPHVTVDTMNDTGQIPFLTHPHRLAKLIRPFLAAEG
ncbi:MAG: alpha/beta fold hydrolase, partial [Planctomycetes bacterium]|nr:alpha/beta fold hydrolase [Planctomycetota bacterium]